MVLGVGLGWVPFTGGWSEFSQFKLSHTFFPDMCPTNLSFSDSSLSNKIPFFCRRLQLWTAGEGYEGWSLANRWSVSQEFFRGKNVKKNIFFRLTERATWPGGKRLQTSGGERAGRSGWYLLHFLFLGKPTTCLWTSWFPIITEGLYLFKSFYFIFVQSWQGGLLWRLAWYLRFLLPNYYGEHTHGDQN